MTACPSPSFLLSPSECVAAKIEVVRQIAWRGRPAPARRLCGTVFLEHLPILARDPALLQVYVGCLLLLEMSALLPPLLRSVFGVELDMVRRGEPGAGRLSGRWSLTFGSGIVLLIPSFGLSDEGPIALWARKILAVAAEDGEGAVVPAAAVQTDLAAAALARAGDFG